MTPVATRREFGGLALGLAAFAAGVAPARAQTGGGTPFWRIRSGAGEVTLLGMGDAQDLSWYSPALRQAFEASAEIWLETPPQSRGNPAELMRAQQFMSLTERTLFDALEPHLVERVKARLAELGIAESQVEKLRPWWAYYRINGAWWARHPPGYVQQPVDDVLIGLAREQGKPVSYEFPTFADLARFMAAMPDKAQSQYIEWLLDTQDVRAAGENDPFGWIEGRRPEASLARMERLPDLYVEMQPKRNRWWAEKIGGLLEGGSKAFVAVGQLHVMGTAGIAALLSEMGIEVLPAS